MTPAMSNRIAVCPGSYDPITNGHIDIIKRAGGLFDEVVVAVVNQSVRKRDTLFTIDERVAFIEEAVASSGTSASRRSATWSWTSRARSAPR